MGRSISICEPGCSEFAGFHGARKPRAVFWLARGNRALRRVTGGKPLPKPNVRRKRPLVCIALGAGVWLSFLVASGAQAQQKYGFGVEAWGQTYRPAGLVQLDARVKSYPWLQAEAQAWAGRSPSAEGGNGDLVVLALRARDPKGRVDASAGRFVLTTGAVRPVHLDGGYARGQTSVGFGVEAFGGVPVTPRFQSRAYDWLVGGRAYQRLGQYGVLGASFVERRQGGREVDQEIGGDLTVYMLSWLSAAARTSYDLVSRGLSEFQLTGSLGTSLKRLELFGSVRNPSLILPATSLFAVLSNTPSAQAGVSGRMRVAPRLTLDALAGYRQAADAFGARVRVSARLWLDDEGKSAVEGEVTRDGVKGSEWTGLRGLTYYDVFTGFRLSGEVELVIADDKRQGSRVWPWGRVSARYVLREAWLFSAGVEGSASPEFVKVFSGLFRVGYQRGPL
jgi:hypothetical protein